MYIYIYIHTVCILYGYAVCYAVWYLYIVDWGILPSFKKVSNYLQIKDTTNTIYDISDTQNTRCIIEY